MTFSKRNLLTGVAAFVFIAGLSGTKNAYATCTTVSTASTTSVALNPGDCIDVTSSGSITAEPAITANFGGAGTLGGISIEGTVTKTGPAGAGSLGAISLDGANASVDILNNGISVTGSVNANNAGRGIYVNDFTVNGGITIGSTGSVNVSNIAIHTVNTTIINGDVTNYGTISSGINAIALGGTGGISGALQNYGTVYGGSLALTVSSAIAGGMINNTGAQIIGAITASSNDFTNNGTFTDKVSSSIAMPSIVGTAVNSTVNNYTQSSTGLFQMVASGITTRGTDYSSVTATGAVNVAGSVFVDVKNTFSASTGDRLASVFQGSSAATNNISSVTDNSLEYIFTAVTNGHNIDLVITDTGISSVTQANNQGGSTSSQNAAQVIDSTSALQNLFTGLTSATSVVNATKSTLPLLNGGEKTAVTTALTSISRIVQARIETNTGLSSGDESGKDQYAWIKPFGSWAHQGDSNGSSGYSAQTGGVVLGMDKAFFDKTRLGISASYANVSLTGNSSDAPSSASINVYNFLGYGSQVLDQNLELNFQLGFGRNQTSGQRVMSFANSVASSNYGSWDATVGTGIGKLFKLDDTTTFTSSVRTDYTWMKNDAYNESGAGILDLNVASSQANQWIFAVDGRVDHHLTDELMLTANLGVGYDVLSNQQNTVAVFAGAPGSAFTSYGIEAGPWLARGGVGLAANIADGTELSLRYDAEERPNFLNQTASAKIRVSF